MTFWLNHVTIDAVGAGSHTVNPSNPTAIGTVVDGSAFTPTSGRLLVIVAGGPVTSGTPSGWTLPSGGSAVSTDGLYVFYKTAAGSDTAVIGHNSAAYNVTFDIYEFASGASFGSSTASAGAASGATVTLSGLTGSNLVFSPVCAPGAAGAFTFTTVTKTFDGRPSDLQSRYAVGNVYTAVSSVGVTATSATHEQLVFSIAGLTNPDATVTVPVATSTAAAVAPTVAASYTASPPAATAAVSAPTPAVTGTGFATVVVPAATATAGALAPTYSVDSTVVAPGAGAAAAAVVPAVTATASATVVAPVASAAAGAVAPFVGSPDAVVLAPAAHATASALTPAPTIGLGADTSNVFNGRSRSGSATAVLTVPVTATPAGTTRGIRVDKAVPLPMPTLVNGRPT